jgi:hypothetical protein
MDPFNPADPNLLGPDGLPIGPKRPLQQPPQPADAEGGAGWGDGLDVAGEGIDAVTDGGIIGGIGDLMSGAVDLAGSAISGGANVMSGVASGAVDVIGTVASGAGEVIGTVASNVPDALGAVADGVGSAIEGAGSAADGCGSCSLAIVFFLAAAGTAAAAVLR